MSQLRIEMVVDFFGLVLLSLSVCLPDVFLDGHNPQLAGYIQKERFTQNYTCISELSLQYSVAAAG